MSILIKDMKMPKDKDIILRIDSKGEVYIYGNYPTEIYEAVELPSHGRLIDVDYADEYAYDELELAYRYLTNWEAARAMQKIYQTAPTIIPAERNE